MTNVYNLILTDDEIDFDKYLTDIPEAAKVIRSSDYRQRVKDSFLSPESERGLRLPWRKATEFRFRPSELTVWTGYNGHKKSMMLGFIMLAMIAQKQKVCIASLEMKPIRSLKRMCRQWVGVAEPTIPASDEFFDWLDGKLWFYDQVGSIKAERMIAVARYAITQLGVNHFVIDSLMMCGISEDDYNKQKWFCSELATLAKDTGAHIHLVAHSRKPSQSECIPSTKYGVSGSANITNMPDNVIVIFQQKDETKDYDVMFIVEKQRNGEHEPKYYLNFDENSLQFKGSKQAQKLSCNEWGKCQWQ